MSSIQPVNQQIAITIAIGAEKPAHPRQWRHTRTTGSSRHLPQSLAHLIRFNRTSMRMPPQDDLTRMPDQISGCP
jgi:hypothetical protein